MSFEPLKFKFTPPPTVETPEVNSTAASTSSTATTPQTSKAGLLIQQLKDLITTAQYLQGVILIRTKTIGVEIDASIDPEMSNALTRIYGTDTPPTIITVNMYNQMLDAHLGVLQLDMAADGSAIQSNPVQAADLITATKTVEKHLVDSASAVAWQALQLRQLKGDVITFQNWSNSLATYPAYSSTTFNPNGVIPAKTLDVSDSLNDYESDVLNRYAQSYSNSYVALATPSTIEQDINAVAAALISQPPSNILRITSLLTALMGISSKSAMSDLLNDLVGFSFVRIASDLSSVLHTADQLLSMSIAPMIGTLGTLGQVMNATQAQAAEVGIISGGALKGMSQTNPSAALSPYNSLGSTPVAPLNVPGVGAISSGVQALSQTVNLAQSQVTSHTQILTESFQKITERKLANTNDQQSLMSLVSSVNSILGITTGITNATQNGSIASSSTSQQQQVITNSILTSLQTGSNSTFTTQNGQIIVNPPDMPPVPPGLLNVLNKSKIMTTIGNP